MSGTVPFLLGYSNRTVKAEVYHIWVLPTEFACGQFLEPFSACCTQVGPQEEGLRKRLDSFALKNYLLFCFYIARYWIRKKGDWVISRMWSARCILKLDFCSHLSGLALYPSASLSQSWAVAGYPENWICSRFSAQARQALQGSKFSSSFWVIVRLELAWNA